MADDDNKMDKADIKKMFNRSKKDPVGVAIGLTKDAEAVILMKPSKSGPALLMMLKKDNPGLKSFSQGTAKVNEDNPKMAVLTLEKKVSGMGPKLKKMMKGTGFSKIRLEFGDGSAPEEEAGDDEEEAEQTPAAAAGAPADGEAAGSAAPSGAADAATPPAAAAPAADAPAAAAPAAAAPAAAAPAAAAPAANGAAKPPSAEKLDLSKKVWKGAQNTVQIEVDKLRKNMASHYADHGFGAELDKVFDGKVKPMMAKFDDKLGKALNTIGKAVGKEQQDAILEARKLINDYKSFVDGQDLIKQLDKNPWGDLAIGETLKKSLTALENAIK